MRTTLGLGLAFLGCAVIAYLIRPSESNAGFKDAASVLAFVSLAAVTIERIIEGVFALLAGPLGEWWPFALAKNEFDRFEAQTNGLLKDVVQKTIDELEAAKAAGNKTQDEIERIDGVIAKVTADQARLAERYTEVTKKLAPGSARLGRVSEINTEITKKLSAVHAAEGRYVTQAQGLITAATETADRASLILSSLKDNPARRIASLVLGTSLGMVVAGAVGMNLFAATLVTAAGDKSSLPSIVAGSAGILLTGIIIGLGSAPTHEVIKSLQADRDGRTSPDQVTTAPTRTTTETGIVAAGMLEMPGAVAAVQEPNVVRQIRRTG